MCLGYHHAVGTRYSDYIVQSKNGAQSLMGSRVSSASWDALPLTCFVPLDPPVAEA